MGLSCSSVLPITRSHTQRNTHREEGFEETVLRLTVWLGRKTRESFCLAGHGIRPKIEKGLLLNFVLFLSLFFYIFFLDMRKPD